MFSVFSLIILATVLYFIDFLKELAFVSDFPPVVYVLKSYKKQQQRERKHAYVQNLKYFLSDSLHKRLLILTPSLDEYVNIDVVELKEVDCRTISQKKRKGVYFGIHREFQFGIFNPCVLRISPCTAREGELFYKGE